MADFSFELERIPLIRKLRQEQIAQTKPDEPHPTCDCGRGLKEHLEEDLIALDALEALFNGNPAPLNERIGQFDLNYFFYAVDNLYREEEFQAELSAATIQKVQQQFAIMQRVAYLPVDNSAGNYLLN